MLEISRESPPRERLKSVYNVDCHIWWFNSFEIELMMKLKKSTIQNVTSGLRFSWLCMLMVLSFNANLFAQDFGQEEEPKTYIPVYIIMIACLGLTLLLMCRAGKRTVDFRDSDGK